MSLNFAPFSCSAGSRRLCYWLFDHRRLGGEALVTGEGRGQALVDAIGVMTASLHSDPATYLAGYVVALVGDTVSPVEINERLIGGLFVLAQVLLDSLSAATGLSKHDVLQDLAARAAAAGGS
jgi:hypothetical protein